jgi:hypothetical protein
LVLPAPAPARIRRGPSVEVTAFFCSEFRFSGNFASISDTIAHALLAKIRVDIWVDRKSDIKI